LKLAGADLPTDREIDGRDIWDVLCGSEKSPHEYLYLFDGSAISAVRSQRWKLVAQSWYRGYNAKFERGYNHTALLFDLENDPAERYSLRREHPEVLKQMYAWLLAGRAALERDTE
jgi:arylsulfatase A-like enzyme